MARKLTELRLRMLAWIEAGHVSRGRDALRFYTGGFPHATAGVADRAAEWLLVNGYAHNPAIRNSGLDAWNTPFELTDKGRAALYPDALITIQPAQDPTGKLPYPFHVKRDGAIARQDFWGRIDGGPARLVGFSARLDTHTIELPAREFRADPAAALNMYAVMEDRDGEWSTYYGAIESVSVHVDGMAPAVSA